MKTCPKCHCDVQEDVVACASCGCDVTQSTASFRPVGEHESAEHEAACGPDGPVLVVRKGPSPGERFYLDRPTFSVGRDPESDIFLNDMTVSRQHAVLDVVSDDVTVRDAGSLNGTYVNGVCVDATTLEDGDVLQIGTFQMVFFCGGRMGS